LKKEREKQMLLYLFITLFLGVEGERERERVNDRIMIWEGDVVQNERGELVLILYYSPFLIEHYLSTEQ
jgi:hypothetical protein